MSLVIIYCVRDRVSWTVLARSSFMEDMSAYVDLTGGTDINVLGKRRVMVFHIGFFLGSMRLYLVLPEMI